jgi:hypothetical protein
MGVPVPPSCTRSGGCDCHQALGADGIVDGNDGRIVETTPGGAQVAEQLIDNSTDASGDAAGFGTLLGLAIHRRPRSGCANR